MPKASHFILTMVSLSVALTAEPEKSPVDPVVGEILENDCIDCHEEGTENIQSQHILRVIQYRSLDRKLFS